MGGTIDWEETKKMLEEYKKKHPEENVAVENSFGPHSYYDTCPNCGYCPHCGRGGYRFVPYTQPYWYPYSSPAWPGGTISGGNLPTIKTYTVS